MIGGPAWAAPGEDDTPIGNPDLPLGCGIDIHVILDESTSISQAGATGDVRQAFRAFTDALKNTGSRMAVSEFSTVARLPLSGAAQNSYTAVTDATIASTFEPYIANGYRPNGSTHWEDAFRIGRYFLPRPTQSTPHLVVFITDGDPNKVVREDRVTYDPGNTNQTQNEYELKVPLADNETNSANENPAKNRAVPNANALKAQGSHILTVAVGKGLNSQSSLDRIIDVSGPDVFSGTGTFDITTDDVYRVQNFSDLEDAMREAAFQLCAPSVNVLKQVDHNPDPAVDDLQAEQGWDMTIDVAPAPSEWVLPPTATGSTATSTTGPDGFVNFQWSTSVPTSSTISVTEDVQAGYVNDPSATACTYRTPDTPTDQPLPDFEAVDGGFSGTVPQDAIVTCLMVNRIPPDPSIDIEKHTNGHDADAAPGPTLAAGSQVEWSFLVTNTGNVPLSSVAVTDSDLGAITCPATILAAGDDMICEATGTAVVGQYENTGTVTASGPDGPETDSDPSHYFGAQGGIDIEKHTNGVDADLPPGPYVPVGGAVDWEYIVTNTGNAPLTGVAVTDDQGVTVDCGGQTTLAVGASMTCTASGTAVAGQYENVGSVTATGPTGQVEDSDGSHYFGEEPEVTIEKSTNLEDADAPPGPNISVGGNVTWSYEVTNTGNVPLEQWTVTDSVVGGVICPRIGIIVPGDTVRCFARGTATAGQYANTGEVEATSPAGQEVDGDDPSHYYGVDPGIQLEKSTNGDDADEAPGPFIPMGGMVNWVYTVTNTGNSTLTNVEVVDFRAVTVTCPSTTLLAGESMDCTATGSAEPDQYTNLAYTDGESPTGDIVWDLDPSHYYGAAPGIHIEKDTNGTDADLPEDAPLVPVGDPVTWTYEVTNTGNDALFEVSVTDDQVGPVTCPQATLAVGAEMTCTATGTAAIGPYENVGSVTGVDETGEEVTDDDPSHYYGAVSGIHVEKSTNGVDADQAPGPTIAQGGAVTWTYVVTNPGNVPIRNVSLVDDRGVVPRFTGGDANGDLELDPGETWTYTASGTAVPGQYANTATVTGLDVLETPVTDSDPSHYYTEPPQPPQPPQPPTPTPEPRPDLRLRKVANDQRVRSGDVVRYRLRVRNRGDATARRVRVCDRLPVGLVLTRARGAQVRGNRACFTVRRLRPQRSRTFTVRARAVITERPRRVCNVATRSARGVRTRRARECIRVLPSAATGRCPTGTTALRLPWVTRQLPFARIAC